MPTPHQTDTARAQRLAAIRERMQQHTENFRRLAVETRTVGARAVAAAREFAAAFTRTSSAQR